MKILVTGGAGFIGSNLAYRLLDLDGDVLVIDDLSSGAFENVDPRSGFRTLDIMDDAFEQAVLDYQPDCIVHLAAQSSVVRSTDDPERTHSVNVEGTRRVAATAKACIRRWKPKRASRWKKRTRRSPPSRCRTIFVCIKSSPA